MLDKEKLLSHINLGEDKVVLTKVLDKVEKSLKSHQWEKSDFLDPHQRFLAEPVLKGIYEVNYKFAGGYVDAERQRIVVFPDYYVPEDVDDGVVCLKVTGNFKFQKVSHRDYLGALLGLGIKREKVGDILPVDEGCQIFIASDLADYVIMNLIKIHKVSVKVKLINLEEVIIPQEKVKMIETTVPSLRLDVIIAAGFGLSRSDASKNVEGEKVKINWGPPSDNSSYQVKDKDVISVKGKGRIEVEAIKGLTAKGRVKITLKKFI